MAKTNEQFDQQFREKLDGHREKPSALAWERLESQLPKQSKPTFGIWWAIAASVTALLVAGYSFWPREEGLAEENLMAEKTEMPAEIPAQSRFESPIEPTTESSKSTSAETETKEKAQKTTGTEHAQNQTAQNSKSTQKPKPTLTPAKSQTSQNLIAEVETTQNLIAVTVPELKTEVTQVTLPELKAPEIEKLVAETTPQKDEEPLYRVSIYSNGVKKSEPQDKNLITELGKTVSQVEGLIGKVDDGLISLQDKKDNLFATLTTKKSQADENP